MTRQATLRQIAYLTDLLSDAGVADPRLWLLDRADAPLSGRVERYYTAQQASDLIHDLKTGQIDAAA